MLPGRVFVGSSHDKAQEEWPYPSHGDDPGIARKSGAGWARGFVIYHLSSVTATHAWPRLPGNRRKQFWRWNISGGQDFLLGVVQWSRGVAAAGLGAAPGGPIPSHGYREQLQGVLSHPVLFGSIPIVPSRGGHSKQAFGVGFPSLWN